MRLFRAAAVLAIFSASFLLISCATSSTVTKEKNKKQPTQPVEKPSAYPDWYNTMRSLASNDGTYRGYATALAADSTKAVQTAINRAEAQLKSGVAGKLESIRNDAVTELGSSSGLNEPNFIYALRRAENAVPDVAQTANIEAQANESHAGYRAFAEVVADKEALIKQLDDTFTGYKKAWKTMKNSQAFSKF